MSTALYRRYRPATFSDVIGQEHVTEPLMQALRTGRIGHAYLFSGPRGCGKTTSARILARCLNCDEGPTPTPCGVCPSCVALATGGPGSVDVIEIDAASHGGVDDARDLREKAAYGPAQSRFKVYIIDEAHMVTPQGFNALLKIVEEPPEHVKFVFATTEPEKVIGTIRSRTHHYPFRLVPPTRLTDYLEELCRREGVAVEAGVLSFVVRAGGGSVRDSLSVLDQLIAGSGDEGLTYAGAAALLGFTEAELLDAVMEALAAGDGGAVFRQLDKVIETGHDPRRFVEDLLERFRDLIVVAASEDGAAAVLRGVPEDQLARMRQQAASFGPGELSRCADLVNAGLSELSGATSPRLQLELICARLLLPGASGPSGHAARLDRLERRLAMAGPPAPAGEGGEPGGSGSWSRAAAPAPDDPRGGFSPTGPGGREALRRAHAAARGDGADALSSPDDGPAPGGQQGGRADGTQGQARTARTSERSGAAGSSGPRPGGESPAQPPPESVRGATGESRSQVQSGSRGAAPEGEARPLRPSSPQAAPRDARAGRPGDSRAVPDQTPAVGQPARGRAARHPDTGARPAAQQHGRAVGDVGPGAATRPVPRGLLDTDAMRRSWPDVLARIFAIRRVTWTFLSEHAQVLEYDGARLVLGIATDGLARTFHNGPHAEVVRQALVESLGVDVRVEGMTMPPRGTGGEQSGDRRTSPATGRGEPRDPVSGSLAPGSFPSTSPAPSGGPVDRAGRPTDEDQPPWPEDRDDPWLAGAGAEPARPAEDATAGAQPTPIDALDEKAVEELLNEDTEDMGPPIGSSDKTQSARDPDGDSGLERSDAHGGDGDDSDGADDIDADGGDDDGDDDDGGDDDGRDDDGRDDDDWKPVEGPRGEPLDVFADVAVTGPGPAATGPAAAGSPPDGSLPDGSPPHGSSPDGSPPSDAGPETPPSAAPPEEGGFAAHPPAGGKARLSAFERAKQALAAQPGPAGGPRSGATRSRDARAVTAADGDDPGVSEDDEVITDLGAIGTPVIAKVLGGVVIDEQVE